MSMAYIRDYYRVPAKRGGRVRWTWEFAPPTNEGTIVGSRGQYLRVRLDGSPEILILHPTWNIVYLDIRKEGS